MSMNRRGAMTSLGLAGPALWAAGAAAATSPQANAAKAPIKGAMAGLAAVDGKSVTNKPHAYEVMEQYGIDGLVALDPMNVYYLTNTIPLMTTFRQTYPAFAVFARDQKQPTYLVTAPPQALALASRAERGEELPVLIGYSGVPNWQDYVNASPQQLKVEPSTGAKVGESAPNSHGWPSTTGAHTSIEKRWVKAQEETFNNGATTKAWALAKALKDAGLAKGKIAVDDMRVAYLLQQIGMTGVTCIPGENIFRRIRVVKSPVELALMRIAGENNSNATEVTMRSIKPGMTSADIEHIFAVECAKLGSSAVTFLTGMALAGLPDGKIVEGKSFAVDAVSMFREYHGDCGRTLVVGEPNKEIKARAKAHRAGYDEIYAKIKAGMKLSDVRRIGKDAMVKAGMPEATIVVNPHSVGVEHGDNPMRDDLPFDMVDDITLQENMVITADLASLDLGWGNLHHEDLIRITKTGFEPFPGIHEPFIII